MAVNCESIVKWYHEVESSLSRDILKVEQLCDTLKRILSQQNTRLKIAGKDDKAMDSSLKEHLEIQQKEEFVDMDEIDKILEKAKSLRLQPDEPAESKHKPNITRNANPYCKSRVPTPKDQKPAAPNKVPAQTVTSSRVKGAGRASAKRVLATRTLHRPRQMTSAKETRGMRGNAGPNRSGIDAKTNRVAAAGAQVSGESAACDGLVRAEKHFDTLSNDAKTAKPRREDAAEHRKEEEKIINKNIVDCCLKIRELKTKLSTLSSAPSREIEHAKKQFLGAVEGSFSSEFIFEPKDSSTDEMQSSFRKSVKSKLIDVSPVSKALSEIHWESTYSNKEQLQQLCQQALKLQELTVELEGKEALFQFCLPFWQSQNLPRSEKIKVYRILHGLLISNGRRLPVLIDDSEFCEHEDDA